MNIKTNDRLLIAGKTGSGKTWLAERLVAPINRLVVIDPKATLSGWNLTDPRPKDWAKLRKGESGRFRILPPVVEDQQAWYEDLFKELYSYGNLTIYIDEAYAVVPPGSRPGRWLSALYTRGRELGIGVWAATQRPAWIPLFMMSEADILIIFRLSLEEDRKRISAIAGEKVLARIPDEHGFWLYKVDEEYPRYYRTAVQRG